MHKPPKTLPNSPTPSNSAIALGGFFRWRGVQSTCQTSGCCLDVLFSYKHPEAPNSQKHPKLFHGLCTCPGHQKNEIPTKPRAWPMLRFQKTGILNLTTESFMIGNRTPSKECSSWGQIDPEWPGRDPWAARIVEVAQATSFLILFVHGISVHRALADIFCAWYSCVPRSVEPRPGIFEAFSTDSWLSEIMSQKCLSQEMLFAGVWSCLHLREWLDLLQQFKSVCLSVCPFVCLSVCLSVCGLVGL